MNKVIMIGRLGKDPEVKYLDSGTAVGKATIAIKERKKTKGEWVDHTEWVNLVCFAKTAENLAKYKNKGDEIAIEGRLSSSSYEKDGEKKYFTEVVCDRIMFTSGSKGEGGGKAQAPQSAISDDDLPF